jgi:hypothetical protein
MSAVCNRDCFNCPYEDCVVDGESALEVARAEQRDQQAVCKPPEADRAYRKRYYEKHRAIETQRSRAYYQEHRFELSDKKREYYLRNRERILAQQKEYRNQKKENAL